MTFVQVPLIGFLHHANIFSIALTILSLYIVSLVASRVYNAYLGPLSRFPGPKSRALTVWPLARSTWNGADNTDVPNLHKQYGKVVRIAPNQLSFLGDGKTFKDIYGFRHNQTEAKKETRFYARPANRAPGLFTADGSTHSRQRKIVSHAFSDKALKEQESMLQLWAKKLRSKLAEQATRREQTDMLKITTFDIMADFTFAEPLHMLDNSEYVSWVKTIFGGIKFGTRLRAIRMLGIISRSALEKIRSYVPSLRKKSMQHLKYITDRIDRRLAKTPDRPDLWSRILEKGGDPRSTDAGLSLQEHYSIASLFMVAGTETTATALSGTMYYLLKNPEYMIKLQHELRSAFSSIDDMHLDSLARVPFLEAVLKEGIRMYPPVPIGLPRVSPPGGMTVGEHFVPEGTVVAVHQLSTYRQEDNFKHAYEFKPERWLGDLEFKDDRLDAFEPFSVGPRNCLGKNLAWHEMRLLLSAVLLHFDVELCKESKDWADQKVYTLWEKPALMCKLTSVKA
ncbi:hypothetical protein PMZ80_000920 [Knufia obscura]|uniref:Cytochrome P450 n=1 Tax=Knufia obscura TaxID=1635080 RepID=A0ABR0S261_9EURO|nr:hypothetical protein PMZ80_000920 [Knufia obscura]